MRKLTLLALLACLAHAEPLPDSMAALGDSITAGALAGFTVPANTLSYWATILGFIHSPFETPPVHSLGDRPWYIKLRLFYERKDLSWTTGYDPFERTLSHYQRLRELTGTNIETKNFAVSGSVIRDVLTTQVPDLEKWANGRGRMPGYITLLIGANDVCYDTINEMTPPSQFRADLEEVIRRVTFQPHTRVLLSSLPQIENLGEIAGGEHYFGELTCRDVWKKVNICPTLTSLPGSIEQVRVKEYVDAYHEIMRDVANRYPAQVKFNEGVHNLPFDPKMISLDCFHPNIIGQRALSDASWNGGWYDHEAKQ